jgi:hypothetical protein
MLPLLEELKKAIQLTIKITESNKNMIKDFGFKTSDIPEKFQKQYPVMISHIIQSLNQEMLTFKKVISNTTFTTFTKSEDKNEKITSIDETKTLNFNNCIIL